MVFWDKKLEVRKYFYNLNNYKSRIVIVDNKLLEKKLYNNSLINLKNILNLST